MTLTQRLTELNPVPENPTFDQAQEAWKKRAYHRNNLSRLDKYRTLTPGMQDDYKASLFWISYHKQVLENYFKDRTHE